MEEGIFLLLGTNEGFREKNLTLAQQHIATSLGKTRRTSSCYKTAAWGKQDQEAFYNLVLQVETRFSPERLLEEILKIEKLMGRERIEKWGSRIIDIDILFFNQLVFNSSSLILPHPLIQYRRFTLVPMAEIAPDFYHPVLKKDVRTLLAECADQL